jgi:gas vesicle protein
MAENTVPFGNYFWVGMTIGSLISVLFAPKSGKAIFKSEFWSSAVSHDAA